MTTFYTTDIDENITLVFTENAIILNAYIDTNDVYEMFDAVLGSMVVATCNELKELSIDDVSRSTVQKMIELDNVGQGSEKDIINFILKVS